MPKKGRFGQFSDLVRGLVQKSERGGGGGGFEGRVDTPMHTVWVVDALKHQKENDKVFHCNDIAQIISEICIFQEGKFST